MTIANKGVRHVFMGYVGSIDPPLEGKRHSWKVSVCDSNSHVYIEMFFNEKPDFYVGEQLSVKGYLYAYGYLSKKDKEIKTRLRINPTQIARADKGETLEHLFISGAVAKNSGLQRSGNKIFATLEVNGVTVYLKGKNAEVAAEYAKVGKDVVVHGEFAKFNGKQRADAVVCNLLDLGRT